MIVFVVGWFIFLNRLREGFYLFKVLSGFFGCEALTVVLKRGFWMYVFTPFLTVKADGLFTR